MELTLDTYIHPHSRTWSGKKTETFDTEDVVNVKPARSNWIEEEIVEIVFSTPPSFYVSKREYFEAMDNLNGG